MNCSACPDKLICLVDYVPKKGDYYIIICAYCKKEIFYACKKDITINAMIKASTFIPVRPCQYSPQPNDIMACPYCHEEFMFRLQGRMTMRLLTTEGVKP